MKDSWKNDEGYSLRSLFETAYTSFGNKILTSELAMVGEFVKGSDVEVEINESKFQGKIVEKIVRENNVFYHISPINYGDARYCYTIVNNITQYFEIPEFQVSYIKNRVFFELIKQNRKHDLPIFLSSEAFSTIVETLIERDWIAIIKELLNQIFDIYDEFSDFILTKSANRNTASLDCWFENKIKKIIKELKDIVQKYQQNY